MTNHRLELYFFGVLFVAILVLVGAMFLPYLSSILVAAVLALLSQPVYRRLRTKLKNEAVAAMITTTLVALMFVVPATGIGVLLVEEVRTLSDQLTSSNMGSFASMVGPIETKINEFLPNGTAFGVEKIVQDGLVWVQGNIAGAFASTAVFVLKLFVGLIALFYLIKDGARFANMFVRFSPLSDEDDREILRALDRTIHSILRGILTVGFLQGLLTGIAFWLFGLPNPVLWGSVAGLLATIPSLGTGLVTVPAGIYFLVTGSYVEFILFSAWGFLIIGLVDNIIGPRVIGGTVHIHPLLILLSILGGLAMFGPVGFLIGPMILGLLVALGEIYATRMHIHKQQVRRQPS